MASTTAAAAAAARRSRSDRKHAQRTEKNTAQALRPRLAFPIVIARCFRIGQEAPP